jgi:hypothetical protein
MPQAQFRLAVLHAGEMLTRHVSVCGKQGNAQPLALSEIGDAFAEFDEQSIALLRHTSIIGYRAVLMRKVYLTIYKATGKTHDGNGGAAGAAVSHPFDRTVAGTVSKRHRLDLLQS